MKWPLEAKPRIRNHAAKSRDRPLPNIELVTLIGIGAALCSTTSFAPQAWKVIRTGDTKALSAPMYAITVTGFGLWLAYGIARAEWPLIVTNAVCLVLSGFILVMKLLPRREAEAVSEALDADR